MVYFKGQRVYQTFSPPPYKAWYRQFGTIQENVKKVKSYQRIKIKWDNESEISRDDICVYGDASHSKKCRIPKCGIILKEVMDNINNFEHRL